MLNPQIDWTAYQGLAKYSPYKLVYGHTTVLPWGIETGLRCIVFQKGLTIDDFKDPVMNNLTLKLSSVNFEGHFLKGFLPK